MIWLEEKTTDWNCLLDLKATISVPEVVARCTMVPAAWVALNVTDTQPCAEEVAGATAIPVVSAQGFSAGQTITIDSGANLETAVVASVTGGGRGGRGGRGGAGAASITVTAPLTMAHAVDAQVSGSGITFTTALTKAHDSGAQIGSNSPTPGAPNQYARRNQ